MMLLDTCVLIWDAIEPDKLTPKAKKAIEYSENELIVCDISIWEISMLIKKNRLTVDDSPSGFIKAMFALIVENVRNVPQPLAE